MTKESYLKALRSNLKKVPSQEVENIMQYYTEYFQEVGDYNTDKVIEELGNPKQLAQKVCADYVIRDIESGNSNGGIKQKASNTWVLVMAIVGSPVWVPLMIAAAIVMFALLIIVVALVFSFFAVAISLAVSSIFMMIVGIGAMFGEPGTGLVLIGTALTCLAATIFMVLLATGILKLVEILIVFIAKKVVKR